MTSCAAQWTQADSTEQYRQLLRAAVLITPCQCPRTILSRSDPVFCHVEVSLLQSPVSGAHPSQIELLSPHSWWRKRNHMRNQGCLHDLRGFDNPSTGVAGLPVMGASTPTSLGVKINSPDFLHETSHSRTLTVVIMPTRCQHVRPR